jgi:hypothetical protein
MNTKEYVGYKVGTLSVQQTLLYIYIYIPICHPNATSYKIKIKK